MAEGARDWLVAAACCEERPAATFADLPRHHQDELVRVGFIAAASVAYFITLAILTLPIPSRNLATAVTLPAATAPRSTLLEALLLEAASARVVPAPAARPRATVALAAEGDSIANPAPPAAAAPRPERRNPVSRFFRGVWRGVRGPGKSDSL
jgi:hypothetical protein